ncbi:Protein LATERAL ROOT PRIMORDIUM 1 [Cardamine amara subsp. amara]|uniref:Protein LATERAL ROOT PRIMORDIUM 1 n=1 Tax=Cardamine amara subsp. amara TaxID=228776 RepID=A0ABD1AJV8_CARAN
MGMVGLRDVFLVAPAYHHQNSGVLSGSDQINSNAAAALGVGVIPLLTTGQPQQNVEDTDINFRRWQSNMDNNQTQYLHFKSTTNQTAVGTSSNNSGSGSGASGTATCQDCGNQAKKECKQRRCRTCCKSRGFDCSTHVKSTWVSAARRRERQVMPNANPTAGSSLSTSSGTKKPRIVGSQQQATSHTSTSNTPPQSFDTSSSRQDGGGSKESWPGQIRAAAVFKCVRVTAVEDGDDEYAYQAVVKIGGHVFKGFLYDQGLEPKEGFPSMSDLHLGGGANNHHNGASTSQPILDQPNVYGGGGGGGGSGGGFYG